MGAWRGRYIMGTWRERVSYNEGPGGRCHTMGAWRGRCHIMGLGWKGCHIMRGLEGKRVSYNVDQEREVSNHGDMVWEVSYNGDLEGEVSYNGDLEGEVYNGGLEGKGFHIMRGLEGKGVI